MQNIEIVIGLVSLLTVICLILAIKPKSFAKENEANKRVSPTPVEKPVETNKRVDLPQPEVLESLSKAEPISKVEPSKPTPKTNVVKSNPTAKLSAKKGVKKPRKPRKPKVQ
jgi:hypothetical protein